MRAVSVPSELDLHRIPGHVAIVVDGDGCSVGETSLVDVVEGTLAIGLRWLTVDVVPEARWGAPIGEVRALLDDVERVLLARRDGSTPGASASGGWAGATTACRGDCARCSTRPRR